MERLIVDVGTAPDAGNGDTLYEAFTKVNVNFEYLFTNQDAVNVFNSSYISLNPTAEDIANGVTDYGILVNVNPDYYVTMMYDSSLPRLDPSTGQVESGAFRIQDSNNNLLGIYTNSISTYDNQNLNLISSGTGIVTVTGTFNYEQQVFQYTNGVIDINNPLDPDALVNAQTLIDYVTAFSVSEIDDRIVSIDDPNSYVEVLGGSEKVVNVLINGTNVADFTETDARIHRILISGNTISSFSGQDVIIQPGTGGNVNVANYRITNLGDPINGQDAVNLRYLNVQLESIGSFGDIDLTNLTDGSLLIYNQFTSKFEASTLLNKQDIDAGVY
jgi:hypothetical protein